MVVKESFKLYEYLVEEFEKFRIKSDYYLEITKIHKSIF